MQQLLESESILTSTSCSHALFLKSYLLASLMAAGSFYLQRLGPTLLGSFWLSFYPYLLLGPALVIFLVNELRARSEKLYVTDRRVIVEKGTLSKSYESLPYSKINDTVIKKRLGDRVFGIGDLLFNTSGVQLRELKVKGLPNAGQIQNEIEEKVETALKDSSPSYRPDRSAAGV